MAPKKIRRVGPLEQFSTARHSLSFYKCVCLTARYNFPTHHHSLPTLRNLFLDALRRVVPEHAALCCGIIGEGGKEPWFVELEEMDLGGCVGVVGRGEDGGLERVLEEQHSIGWEELERRPAWRLVIVEKAWEGTEAGVEGGGGTQCDVIFAFHHAICDGMSGIAFHRNLLRALRALDDEEEASRQARSRGDEQRIENEERSNADDDTVIKISPFPRMVPSVHELVDFKLSLPFMLREAWKGYAPAWLKTRPPIWTAYPYFLPQKNSALKTHIRLLQLPAPLTKTLLSACRQNNSTLTGLLHGATIATLASLVPSATAFACTTPYQLRGLTGVGEGEVVVQLSGFEWVVDVEEGKYGEGEMVWEVARKFGERMRAEKARLPRDNMLGLMGYVGDWHAWLSSRLSQPRASTYEISNLGAAIDGEMSQPTPFPDTHNNKITITQAIFTQSASVAGDAFNLNVVGVKDGGLNLSLTWQAGVFRDGVEEGEEESDGFGDRLVRGLEGVLGRIALGKGE